jgi:large subunit ribosomal protein L29
MRLAHAVTPLENPIKLRHARKDVARVNTELRRRQIEGETK